MDDWFPGEDDGLEMERNLDRDEERIPYRQRDVVGFCEPQTWLAQMALAAQAERDRGVFTEDEGGCDADDASYFAERA
jgi:hypothetical protein